MEGNPRGHLPTDVTSLDGGYREYSWEIAKKISTIDSSNEINLYPLFRLF
jgi:hypothetical protein